LQGVAMVNLQELIKYTKKLSLLYIDENQEILLQNTTELRKIFAQVDDASDATIALSYIKLNNYDIVIVDSKSNIMSIRQLVENIRAKNKFQDIIITTSEDDDKKLLALYSLSVNSLLKKPFTMGSLLQDLLHIAERLSLSNQTNSVDIEKLNEDLQYERKRIGRFMLQEKKLNDKIKSFEEKINIDKNIYELTRLPSRYALQEAINGTEQSLLYINIDHFDFVNSIYGMGKANKLLKECAKRLDMYLSKNAELFHITADEFVILLDNPVENQDKVLAKQIQALFKEAPVEFDEHLHYVIFSIGIDRGQGKQLFVNAKSASREARYYGGDQMIVYNPKSNYMKEQRDNLYWIKVLQQAFEEDKVFVYFQPIIDNKDPKNKHYEVLCRLMDENNKLINADKFIHSAKLIGFITQITKTVIDRAFKMFSQNDYSFSINISMYDLHENYLVDFLEYKCNRYSIERSRVHLEIIEDIILSNSESIDKQIVLLKEKGYKVVIDDFSTEKSFYSRIFDIQAQYIKIDGSFTKDIDKDKAHLMILKGIVEFAKLSGIKTIAEHIEDPKVYEIIKEIGIDYSQGFLLAKPSSKLE
jgi:diguanylate cyclase (GGDEF)-like protein